MSKIYTFEFFSVTDLREKYGIANGDHHHHYGLMYSTLVTQECMLAHEVADILQIFRISRGPWDETRGGLGGSYGGAPEHK